MECPACLVVGRVRGLRKARVSHERYPEYLSLLASLVKRGGRTRAFVESFVALEVLAGGNPYQGEKDEINEAMLKLVEVLEERFEEFSTLELLEASAAANAVDVAMLDYSFEGRLEALLDEKPVYAYTSRERVGKLLENAADIALILDNAGEAVVDLVVAKLLSERGYKVTIYARSRPYETDITVEEARRLAERIGLHAEVRGSGSAYPPHHPASNARREVEKHELVLAKGIANLETSLEAPLPNTTISLLRAKCKPLARLFNTRLAAPIVTEPLRIPLRLEKGTE